MHRKRANNTTYDKEIESRIMMEVPTRRNILNRWLVMTQKDIKKTMNLTMKLKKDEEETENRAILMLARKEVEEKMDKDHCTKQWHNNLSLNHLFPYNSLCQSTLICKMEG